MLEPPAAFAGLEDLLDLGHGSGIDMRPTLLRVLTDLYLQRPTHALEDERYYTELALRLVEAVDTAPRAMLAARLAPYPSAPRPVIERLARDVIEVAGPILEQSACLTAADLAAIAAEYGGAHAERIAKRPPPPAPPVPAGRPADPAETAASELSDLFYAADTGERRLILINWPPRSARTPGASSRPRSSVTPKRWCESSSARSASPARRRAGSSATSSANRSWSPPKPWPCRRMCCSAFCCS